MDSPKATAHTARSASTIEFPQLRLSISQNYSTSLAPAERTATDSCPGALRMFQASDGLIGRIRMPGGRVRAADWTALADLADDFGDGHIHLTSRGNLQIRGIDDQRGFAARMTAIGFLPSPEHDLVRNILSSPLAPELFLLIDAIDNAIMASPIAAGLSGRTLFGVDSGGGEIIAQRPDFAVIALANSENYQLVLGAQPLGKALTATNVPRALVAAAELWQTQRGQYWRIEEHPLSISLITQHLDSLGLFESDCPAELPANPLNSVPIGWLAGSETISLGAGLKFGQLSSTLARFLGAIDTDTSVTPWNSIVIHKLPEAVAEHIVKVLAPLGLIFDADSPWLSATACTGLPGCSKSQSDVRGDLEYAINSGQLDVQEPVHFVGCARRCGHPMTAHTEYQATADNDYEIFER